MADPHFGGIRPWEMGAFTLQEYIGMHYYRRELESQD